MYIEFIIYGDFLSTKNFYTDQYILYIILLKFTLLKIYSIKITNFIKIKI